MEKTYRIAELLSQIPDAKAKTAIKGVILYRLRISWPTLTMKMYSTIDDLADFTQPELEKIVEVFNLYWSYDTPITASDLVNQKQPA